MFIQMYISISPEHGHIPGWFSYCYSQAVGEYPWHRAIDRALLLSIYVEIINLMFTCNSVYSKSLYPSLPRRKGKWKIDISLSFVSEIPLFVRRHLMERNAREFCRCGESSDESWARKWRRWFINEENDRWSSVDDLSIIWWRIKQ